MGTLVKVILLIIVIAAMMTGMYMLQKRLEKPTEKYSVPDLELKGAMRYEGNAKPITYNLRTTPSIDEPAPIEIVPNNGLFVPPTIPQMGFLIDKSMSMFA